MMFSANRKWIYKDWARRTAAVVVRLKAVAPYALIELVLPGGSLMALALWLYRQRKNGVGLEQWRARLLSFLPFLNPLPRAAVFADRRS